MIPKRKCLIKFDMCAGRGSATPSAEQNFFHDPESAYIVLKEMSNITILPYEVCLRHPISGVGFFVLSIFFSPSLSPRLNYGVSMLVRCLPM